MYTVLIVEDEMLVSVGLRNMISWSDLNMTIIGDARNGKQGLELYRQKKPDIILTDIKMPVMDGLEMITEIRKEDTATKIIVLSSYEDYDLVRQAFVQGISDYILKLKMMPEEMEKLMRKVQRELLEEQIPEKKESDVTAREDLARNVRLKAKAYITQPFIDHNEFATLAERLQISEAGLSVCMSKLLPPESTQQTEDKRHDEKVLQAIRSLMENLLSEHKRGVVWIEEENRYLIVLCCGNVADENKRNDLRQELLSRIQSAVKSGMNRNMVFGVSSFADSYEQLNQLYTEATKALDEAFFLEDEIVYYGDPGLYQEYDSILDAFEERMLEIEELTDGYQPKVKNEISYLKKEKLLQNSAMKEVVIRWVHWASYEEHMHKKEVMQLAIDTVEQIRCAVSLEEMLRSFESYLTAKNQDKKESKTLNRELAEAISYIKIHYSEEDISLPKVAQEVSIHKDYLSKLFKRELGVGFSDYVNSQRIKKARELLRTTHMRSYEISQAVGFQDESYFSRVFKKVVGMRPNEYKRCEMSEIDFTYEE